MKVFTKLYLKEIRIYRVVERLLCAYTRKFVMYGKRIFERFVAEPFTSLALAQVTYRHYSIAK